MGSPKPALTLIVKFALAVLSSGFLFLNGVKCLNMFRQIIFHTKVRILADRTDPDSGLAGPRYLPRVIFEAGNAAFCSL
jgi:hypothetical protein